MGINSIPIPEDMEVSKLECLSQSIKESRQTRRKYRQLWIQSNREQLAKSHHIHLVHDLQREGKRRRGSCLGLGRILGTDADGSSCEQVKCRYSRH